ncbi:MAG: hypothetical protein IGS38_16755 [Synechococcales cyanobacterium M58_A2018_015]|nr:hypothetical protein [Synechococcales cyanobacterium M58_A2018_015]
MSVQKFSLAVVKQVQQYIRATLALTELDHAALEIPEPESLDELSSIFEVGGLSSEARLDAATHGAWSVSRVNPAAALLKLPGLRLKPGLRLISYLYRNPQHSSGRVFALPEIYSTTALLEKALATSGDMTQPPRPEAALPHFMDAIEGDRSPVSFLVASLLQRELQEFGADGQHCQWSHHQLLDAVPTVARWQWQIELPKDFSPKVKVLTDGQAAVEFFTYRIRGGLGLYRHIDQYAANHYTPRSLDKLIAVGGS